MANGKAQGFGTLCLLVIVAGILVGIVGIVFVANGFIAKGEIKERLAAEEVTATIGEEKVLVADAKTAQIQADTIKDHTLGKFGPYSKMSREDPNRATYINGLVLRNALTIARMSLNLSDMVVGLGVTLILAGFAITGSGVVLLGIGKQGQYSAGTGGRVSG